MKRSLIVPISLLVLLLMVITLRLGVGAYGLAWPASGDVWELRWLRVGSGLAVGAALAVGGVLLQSLLRNPLASPDLLGLASGAGLGLSVAVLIAQSSGGGSGGGSTALGLGALLPAAVIGALATLSVVYALSQRGGAVEPVLLVLVGVIVAVIAAAATRLVQHFLPDRGLALSRWMLGALPDDISSTHLAVVGAITLAGVVLAAWLGPMMDAAALSDDEARALGVPLGTLRTVQFALSGVLAAAAVVLAGPLGFVGLVGPHAVRLLAGPSHRVLVIGSAPGVRAIDLGSGRMPLGVITAIIGGPIFLAMLRRWRRN